MKTPTFPELAHCITGGEMPRVWSLLVSLFGELAQERKARIASPLLHHLTDLIGIKPEATRVALHRLRKDGWIESHRIGRTSQYSLTASGQRESAAASPRIYGTHSPEAVAWLVLTNPDAPYADKDWVRLGSSMFVARQKPPDAHIFSAPIGPDAPGWMRDQMIPKPLVDQCRTLTARLQMLCDHAPSFRSLDSRQVAALRVLVVHEWRRVILKSPDLPDFVLPDAWLGPACRAHVNHLLTELPNKTTEDLAAMDTTSSV